MFSTKQRAFFPLCQVLNEQLSLLDDYGASLHHRHTAVKYTTRLTECDKLLYKLARDVASPGMSHRLTHIVLIYVQGFIMHQVAVPTYSYIPAHLIY